MKSCAILRNAARRIESGKANIGLCNLISCLTGYDVNAFDRAMGWLTFVAPSRRTYGRYWFGPPAWNGGDQSHRITAACMAAAIAESEGD